MTSKHIATIDEEPERVRFRFEDKGSVADLVDLDLTNVHRHVEIVRPSRDGIHGRELIGTSVDLGSKPMRLQFTSDGKLLDGPKMMTIRFVRVYCTT